LLLHPNAIPHHNYTIAGFNTASDEGRTHYSALVAYLAARYSGSHQEGLTEENSTPPRVWGYIIGNEVNSPSNWYHLGDLSLDAAVAEYHQAVRLAHDAVRLHSSHARVYLSFDHFWNTRMPGASELQAYST